MTKTTKAPTGVSEIDRMNDLGLPIPATITKALDNAQQARVASRTLSFTPEPLAPEVLLGKDAAERIVAFATAQQAAGRADTITKGLVAALGQRVESAVRTARPAILDQLQAWFVEHLDDLCTEGSDGLHPTRAEHLTMQRRSFEQLHALVLGGHERARHAGALFDAAPWFVYFDWSSEQWTQLVNATGPAFELRRYRGEHNVFGVARAIGAKPSLVRDWESVRARYLATRDGLSAGAADRARLASAAAAFGGTGR